jgi:Holliday junction resolvase-like predicted endonuclease
VLLIAKGYRIAARRWKTLLGEIDRGGGAGSF